MAKKIEILENTLLKLLVRRGTDTDRRNIALSEGELGYTTDTERLFIGNGETGGVVAGNKFLGCDSDPATTFSTALTGDLAFNTNTKSLCAYKGVGTWERVSTITDDSGDIDISVDAGDVLANALGRNLSIDTNGRVQTESEVTFNKIDTINTAFLSIPRNIRFYDNSSSKAFTFPTNALGGKYLRTDANGVLSWEDPVGAAEFFYNSENGPIPVGAVIPFTAAGVIPTGYLVCDGQEVTKAAYTDLYDVIGESYGTTNTGVTFKVPDYIDRTLYGSDVNPVSDAPEYKVGADVNIGSTFGTEWSQVSRGYGGVNSNRTFQSQPTTYTNDTGYYLSIKLSSFSAPNDASFVYCIFGDVNYATTLYNNNHIQVIHDSNSGGGVHGAGSVIVPPGEKYTFFSVQEGIVGIQNLTSWELRGPASSSTSGTTITQQGFGSYSTGWVNSFGGKSFTDVTTNYLTTDDKFFGDIVHGLGTTDLLFEIWLAEDANGLNAFKAETGYAGRISNDYNKDEGVYIDDVTDNTFSIQLGNGGPYKPTYDHDDTNPGSTVTEPWSGLYIKIIALAANAVVTTPSTQSPLSAAGTIYVIKAIPDQVANPTLTVVSPLTATVNGVDKTNTAFTPLSGDIVIGQPDAAEAVPPGVMSFDTNGATTFTTVTRYTKFHVTGSGSSPANYTGGSAGTCIGYLDLPVGTVLDLIVGAGVGNAINTGNYSQISHNGNILVKSDGADHPSTSSNTFNWNHPPNTGTLDKAYTFNGNQVVSQGSFIIPGASQGVDGNGDDEESIGSASFWGAYPAAGAGMHANGTQSRPSTTADGMVMLEWVDTVSGGGAGGAATVSGGGSSLLRYGTIDVGDPGPITGGSIPTTGDFTTIDSGNDGANFYDIFECTFNSSLSNNNYNVVFELISNGSVNSDNNMRYPIITEKTAAGFKFSIEEGTTSVQDLKINARVVSNEANAVIADQKWEAVTDGTYNFDQASNLETSEFINNTGSPLVIRAQFDKIAVTGGSPDDIIVSASITHAGETSAISVPFATEIGFVEPTGYSTVVGNITIPAGATYKFVRVYTNYTNIYWYKMTTTAVVGGAALLEENGYQILPSGMIMQWGKVSHSSVGNTVVFPIPFPNACFNVTGELIGTDVEANLGITSITETGFSMNPLIGSTSYWQAIGW